MSVSVGSGCSLTVVRKQRVARLASAKNIRRRNEITVRRGSDLANLDEGPIDAEIEPEGWIIEIIDDTFGNMILGFKTEAEARAAHTALKVAFVLGEGGSLTLQNRDENENWIVIEDAILE